MLNLEYDVAEMSIASYVAARVRRNARLTALPVFPGRRFPQFAAYCRGTEQQLTNTGQLPGAGRVGAPQYWLSSSVWHRCILQSHYGIDVNSLSWFTTVDERDGTPPTPAPVTHVARGRDHVLHMLVTGEIDVALLPRSPSDLPLEVATLFPDPAEASIQYHRETNVFPIMHLVVVHDDLLDNPGFVEAVVEAFDRAHERAKPQLSYAPSGLPVEAWTYDLESNRPTLEVFLNCCREQGLVEDLPGFEDLFPDFRRV